MLFPFERLLFSSNEEFARLNDLMGKHLLMETLGYSTFQKMLREIYGNKLAFISFY